MTFYIYTKRGGRMELNGDQIDALNQLIEFYYSKGLNISIADVTQILYPASTNKGDDTGEGHAKLKSFKKNT